MGGLTGFGCAIGIHYPMDYLSVSHLAPAWLGAVVYLVGIVLLWRRFGREDQHAAGVEGDAVRL